MISWRVLATIVTAWTTVNRRRAAGSWREDDRTSDQSRQAILARFRAQIARGEPIIGGGAGTGLSAVSEEAGGIDLLIVYNSGRYRMAGRGSSAGLLAYGNANQIVKEMAYEILPVVKRTPVLAGVNGTDPFIIPKLFLEELRHARASPASRTSRRSGSFDGDMRQAFEETGMSYELEVDIIRLAHELDLLTTPYVFNTSEAERMADAGADLIVAHMGVTTGGTIGAKSAKTLDDCVDAGSAHRGCRARRQSGRASSSATAARSPSRRTRPTSSRTAAAWTGSTARARSSACRPSARSPIRFGRSRRFDSQRGQEAPMSKRRTREAGPSPSIDRSTRRACDYAPWGKHGGSRSRRSRVRPILTLVRVTMPPGTGHQFHRHPELEEIIYVVDGHRRAVGGPGEAPAQGR